MARMAETKPIPVRLPGELIARLDAAAKRIGHTRAGVIRFCVETWLRHFELKGRACLPVDWDEIMKAQDGRRMQRPETSGGSRKPDPRPRRGHGNDEHGK